MTVFFRNVEGSVEDPVRTWPSEALAEVMERGLLQDWKPILTELRHDPWGPVARRSNAGWRSHPMIGRRRTSRW